MQLNVLCCIQLFPNVSSEIHKNLRSIKNLKFRSRFHSLLIPLLISRLLLIPPAAHPPPHPHPPTAHPCALLQPPLHLALRHPGQSPAMLQIPVSAHRWHQTAVPPCSADEHATPVLVCAKPLHVHAKEEQHV